MPTLTIGGRDITVGDDFLKLSPEQQSATVEEIAGSLGTSPSPADKLLGRGTERYQTWPERLIRSVGSGAYSGATLGEDMLAGRAKVPGTGLPGTSPEASPGRVLDLASIALPIAPRAVPGIGMAETRPVRVSAPSTKELAAEGGRDIQAAKNSGLDIRGQAVSDYSQKVQQDLFNGGIHPVQAPSTFAILKDLENASPDAVFTAANLQSLREQLSHTAQNFNPNAAKDQLAASRAIKQIDQFIPSVAPQDVLAGTPAATQALFERGRGNYAAGMRSNDITGVLDRARTGIGERAQARSQAANSGRNIDNTIRQKVEGFLEKPKEVSGYNDAELAALDRIVQGGGVRNTSRYVGNLFGGGGGIGQAGIGVMGATGGALGLGVGGVPGAGIGAAIGGTIPVATGAIAKSVANVLARRDLRGADELIRQRSPLFLERQAEAGTTPITPEARAAVLRALMLEYQPQQ